MRSSNSLFLPQAYRAGRGILSFRSFPFGSFATAPKVELRGRIGHYSVWKLMPLKPSQGNGLRFADVMLLRIRYSLTAEHIMRQDPALASLVTYLETFTLSMTEARQPSDNSFSIWNKAHKSNYAHGIGRLATIPAPFWVSSEFKMSSSILLGTDMPDL